MYKCILQATYKPSLSACRCTHINQSKPRWQTKETKVTNLRNQGDKPTLYRSSLPRSQALHENLPNTTEYTAAAKVFEFLEASVTKCWLVLSWHTCAVEAILFMLGPESAFGFKYSLLLLPCLLPSAAWLEAGWGIDSPAATFFRFSSRRFEF